MHLQDEFDISKYKNEFINGPMGEARVGYLLKSACHLAGLEPRANHGMRRTFIEACYRAGMPEVAIMRLTRHTALGLRSYVRWAPAGRSEHSFCRQAVLLH